MALKLKRLFKMLAFSTAIAITTTGSVQVSAKPGKQVSKKALKQKATQEKLTIGGDVPVIAWSDSSVESWAVILCIHGLGLHKGSYAALGNRLAAVGVPTYAMDVRGFGSWLKTESQNRVDFKQTMLDVKSTLQAIRLAHPDLPIVILGESMGGAIALQTASTYPALTDGLVSCVPSGDRFGQKMTAAKVAINLIKSPNRVMDLGKNLPDKVSEDPQLKQDWSDDPQARLHLTAKELFEFQSFMNQNLSYAKQQDKVPTLVVQGANDRLVKSSSTIEIFNNIATRHKDLLLIGNSEHLVFENGQFMEHVVDVLTSWIEHNVLGTEDEKHNSTPSSSASSLIKEKDTTDEQQKMAAGHLHLARGYLLTNRFAEAKEELKLVLSTTRSSSFAREADALLFTLPAEFIAPKTGPQTKASVEDLKLISLSGAMSNDKASVLLFCAPWVEACDSLKESVFEVMGSYKDQLNFVEINADNPNNAKLLSKYAINPLPAVLFLNGKNEVVSYILGNDKAALKDGLSKILEPSLSK